jgi:hypothetical protein
MFALRKITKRLTVSRRSHYSGRYFPPFSLRYTSLSRSHLASAELLQVMGEGGAIKTPAMSHRHDCKKDNSNQQPGYTHSACIAATDVVASASETIDPKVIK